MYRVHTIAGQRGIDIGAYAAPGASQPRTGARSRDGVGAWPSTRLAVHESGLPDAELHRHGVFHQGDERLLGGCPAASIALHDRNAWPE